MEEEELNGHESQLLDKLAQSDTFKKWNNPANSKLVNTNAFNFEQHRADFDSSKQDLVDEGTNPFLNQFVDLNAEDPYSEIRAQNQSFGAKLGKGILRAVAKAGIEIAKMPGVVIGAAEAPFAEDGEKMATFTNNYWTKALNSLGDVINDEVLPVYVRNAVKTGDLWDNLTSVDFWATEGADGAGFIASMFVPGALIKSFNLESKISKLATMSSKFARAQKLLGFTGKAVEEGAITAANTIFESASEAGSAIDSFEKDLNRRKNLPIGDPEHIDNNTYNELMKQKGSLGRDIFLTNLAILAGPNAINTRLLFSTEGRALSKGIKNAEGKLLSEVASPTLIKRAGKIGEDFIHALGREGFFEEGLQSTTENYFKKQANRGELGDNPLKDVNLLDFGKEYLDMLSTVDGQKAIALGGLMGSPLDIVHDYKSGNKDRAETNRLLKLGREVSQVYFATSPDGDIWKRTNEVDPETGEYKFALANGRRQIDPTKRDELVKKSSNAEVLSKLFDIAENLGEKEAVTLLQGVAEDNLIMPFITNNDIGVDMLREYLKENPNMNPETSKRILKKAETLQKTQNEFRDFSKDMLSLGDENTSKPHIEMFHQMLNQVLLKTKSNQLVSEDALSNVKNKISEILKDKGLTDDIDQSIKNDVASTDIRLENLYKKEAELKNKLEKLKEDEHLVWNRKEQQKAFKEFIGDVKKKDERESPDKVEAADKVMDDINKATTRKDVADATKTKKEKEDSKKEDFAETTPFEEISEDAEKEVTVEEDHVEKLDPETKAAIESLAKDKLAEITEEEEKQIAEASEEIAQQVEDENTQLLGKVANLEPFTIGNTSYTIIHMLGVYIMNTDNNSESATFTTMEEMIEYFEKKLNANVIPEEAESEDSKTSFEATPVTVIDHDEADKVLSEGDKENEGSERIYPTIELLGVDTTKEKLFDWLPEGFKKWLTSFKDKKGTPVTFSMPEASRFSYDKVQRKAVELFNSGEFGDRDFLYRYLPIQVNIDEDTFTFIKTLTKGIVDEGTPRYNARKNIVEAILNNSGNGHEKYSGLTSNIDYQKGGDINYIPPDNSTGEPIMEENNISALPGFNNDPKNVPLFFVQDDLGNIEDEKGKDASAKFPKVVRSGQTGYVYTIMKSHNGREIPIKANVRKMSLVQAKAIYTLYKTLYLYNKQTTNKLTAKTAKLTDLYKFYPNLQTSMEKNFQAELNVFKDKSKITLAEFSTLLIHPNLALDGSTKPYTTVFRGAGITFGDQGSFVNFEKESSAYQEAFEEFMTTQKRQNVKLNFLAGKVANIDAAKYKEYLINEKVIHVNLDTSNPLKGDINVYLSSDVKASEKPTTKTTSTESLKPERVDAFGKDNPNVDPRIIDIERRRQEELNKGKTLIREFGNVAQPNGNVEQKLKEIGSFIKNTLSWNITYINASKENNRLELTIDGKQVNLPEGANIRVQAGNLAYAGFNLEDIINAKYDAELATLRDTKPEVQKTEEKPLTSEKKNVPLPPGSKGGKFSKKKDNPGRPDGFEKTGC